ncbi:MAG: hypothetical protein ACKVZH_10425 [Blastocatellia bacterium]
MRPIGGTVRRAIHSAETADRNGRERRELLQIVSAQRAAFDALGFDWPWGQLMYLKSLFLVVFGITALSSTVSAQCKFDLKIGAKIPAKCLPKKSEERKYIATHPSQLRPFIEQKVDGVKYTVAFDEETRRIKYIHTVDRAFRTVNGLQVLSRIEVTKEQITGGFGGWYTFAGQTPDGWDIIVASPLLPSDEKKSDWKKDEVKTMTIAGFKKGGN